MSRLVARILLSMFMFPLGVMVYALTMAVGEQAFRGGGYRDREQTAFLLADAITWAAVGGYWCLLWRTGVRWSGARVGWTVAAAAGAIAVGGTVAFVIVSAFGGSGSDSTTIVLFLGGVLAILLWLFATVFVWRETAAERAGRVSSAGGSTVTCPTCGYNLTGLAEARCPECGRRFTLDELLAAQPARGTAADLE